VEPEHTGLPVTGAAQVDDRVKKIQDDGCDRLPEVDLGRRQSIRAHEIDDCRYPRDRQDKFAGTVATGR